MDRRFSIAGSRGNAGWKTLKTVPAFQEMRDKTGSVHRVGRVFYPPCRAFCPAPGGRLPVWHALRRAMCRVENPARRVTYPPYPETRRIQIGSRRLFTPSLRPRDICRMSAFFRSPAESRRLKTADPFRPAPGERPACSRPSFLVENFRRCPKVVGSAPCLHQGDRAVKPVACKERTEPVFLHPHAINSPHGKTRTGRCAFFKGQGRG